MTVERDGREQTRQELRKIAETCDLMAGWSSIRDHYELTCPNVRCDSTAHRRFKAIAIGEARARGFDGSDEGALDFMLDLLMAYDPKSVRPLFDPVTELVAQRVCEVYWPSRTFWRSENAKALVALPRHKKGDERDSGLV